MCVCVHMCVCVCAMCTRVHVYVCVCVHMCVCVCAYVCAHAFVYTVYVKGGGEVT